MGMTQEQVATKLGLLRSAIAKWETGRSLPRADMLPKIAALYNCSIDALLSETEKEETE